MSDRKTCLSPNKSFLVIEEKQAKQAKQAKAK
jgi:hypothetical protein